MEEKRYANLDLKALEIKDTLGTGSFGRVRLVKVLSDGKFFALKILKKSEVIYLKQVQC
jgi:serine/threonine protein kinase